MILICDYLLCELLAQWIHLNPASHRPVLITLCWQPLLGSFVVRVFKPRKPKPRIVQKITHSISINKSKFRLGQQIVTRVMGLVAPDFRCGANGDGSTAGGTRQWRTGEAGILDKRAVS